MSNLINQVGSVEDIRCRLKFTNDLDDYGAALKNELQNKRRSTVINLLNAAIKKHPYSIKIEFEDNWQDCQWWIVNVSTGKIIDAGPFQFDIWTFYYINIDVLVKEIHAKGHSYYKFKGDVSHLNISKKSFKELKEDEAEIMTYNHKVEFVRVNWKS